MSNQFFTLPYQPSVGDGVGVDITGLEIEVFVDAINGDDRRGGRSAEDSLRTIQMARQKFAMMAMDGTRININLAGVGGFGANATGQATYEQRTIFIGGTEVAFNSYRFTGPEMVRVTPTTGPSSAGLSAIDVVDQSGAVSGTGQRTRFTFAGAPGWTADDFQGKFLRITRLAGGINRLVVFEQVISKNTTDEIFVDTPALTTVLLTDTVEIVEPGAIITGIPADSGMFACLGWSSGDIAIFGVNVPYTFTRIRFDTTFLSTFDGISGLSFDRCLFVGLTSIRNSTIKFASSSSLGAIQFARIDTANGFPQCFNPPETAPIDPAAFIEFQVAAAGLGGAFNLFEGSTFAFTFNFSVWDSSIGVNCIGGFITIEFSAIQGINSVVGIQASQNGNVKVSATPALRLITGPGGAALRVGTGGTPAIDYGAGVGEFDEPAGFAGNFTRKNEGTATAPVGDASSVQITGAV